MKPWTLAILPIAFAALALAAKNPVLNSVRVVTEPTLDGIASEDFWNKAPPLMFKTTEAGDPGVANKSETSVTVRSVYTNDSVFFLVSWLDPTYSIDRQRWAFNGQKWSKEDQVPLGQGGANVLYEDKIAFMWSINAPTFEREGPWATYRDLASAQAAGYDRPVKAAASGELLDLWHYKLVRNGFTNPGQVDDQFIDDTFSAAKAGEAGRKSDPGTGGYYNNERDMTLSDGSKVKVPKYGFKNGNSNAYILTQDMIDRGEAIELSDVQVMSYSQNAHIPAIIGRAFGGSRGDITGQFSWRGGRYILEFGRKLNTNDPTHDVEFLDLAKTYFFGIATFDNTQIKHAVSDLVEFKFRK